MNQIDAFRRESVQPLAPVGAKSASADPAATTRLDLVKALLAARNGELVDKLAARNRPQLYGFTAGIEQLPLLPHRCGSICTSWQPTAATPTSVAPCARRSTRAAMRGRAVVILSRRPPQRRPAGRRDPRAALNQRKVPLTFVLGIGPIRRRRRPSHRPCSRRPEKVFQKESVRDARKRRRPGYDPMQVTVQLARISNGSFWNTFSGASNRPMPTASASPTDRRCRARTSAAPCAG